jgi:hypothetical protein
MLDLPLRAIPLMSMTLELRLIHDIITTAKVLSASRSAVSESDARRQIDDFNNLSEAFGAARENWKGQKWILR